MTKNIPVTVGQVCTVKIESMGESGEGVGRYQGFTLFIPQALPGEDVTATVTAVKKNYALGRLQGIITAAPGRVEPPCPHYPRCGGCQLQHLSYPEQLKVKRQKVKDALRHIGGLPNVPVLPVLGGEPWHYRNKMQFPVGKTQGKIVLGCFAAGSHQIIDTPACLIQQEYNNELATVMRRLIAELKITVYNEDKHTGLLRHVMGRVGSDGELMAVLVTATEKFPQAKMLVKKLREALPQLASVQQNIQTYHNNVILGRETKLLWGKPTISDRLGDLRFNISPRSFFQVNTAQATTLYGQVLAYANLHGREEVIDAYCGTGTITLFLAAKAGRVYGTEIVSTAVQDAKKNARDNRLKNVEFLLGDAKHLLPTLQKKGLRADVIVTDPPRAGCDAAVLTAFAQMHPRRIVYVSCNPATLARDLKILQGLGYQTKEVQPVDMFPQTTHVECVALLTRD
ncbi:MAG: 23S rRNA (uracil(1939)-C(5))-methyltransferase RlmD [Selenomonadaceae bacterium]|nr:23S rRNA (uracil(1939)-C(5))-methyltransferase RlmD [Selenomonadaceae bacterium]